MTYEFTKKQHQEIRALVNECANYDRSDRICLLTDGPCYMMLKVYNNGKICKYFKEAVLPLNPILDAAITHREPTVTRSCEMCKNDYIPKTNRQQYCSEKCKSEAKKMRNRERNRKYRENNR